LKAERETRDAKRRRKRERNRPAARPGGEIFRLPTGFGNTSGKFGILSLPAETPDGSALVTAVNAGGNWTTTSLVAIGPLYRNANNSRSTVNVNNGGRGSIRGWLRQRLRVDSG